MNGLTRSAVNPYAPPESPGHSEPSDPRRGRPTLAILLVFPAMFVGVSIAFASPPLGLGVLVVTHILDRRLFDGPPFLS